MKHKLKIATYNIQHGTNTQKIVENINILAQNGVSLFCLQEVRHSPNKAFIVDALLSALGQNWRAEYLISSKTFDLGLCTIWDSTKLTATKFDQIFLPKTAKIKLYEKMWLKMYRKFEKVDHTNINPETKAALIGEFSFNRKSFRITNTHLDWIGGSKQRYRQLEHIKNKLDSSSPQICEIICGDFNTLGYYRFSKRIKKQISSLFEEEFLSVLKNSPTTTFWQALDHIFVKNLEIEGSQIFKLKGSDHYPILAEIKI